MSYLSRLLVGSVAVIAIITVVVHADETAPVLPRAPMPSYGEWTSSRIGGGGYVQNVVPSATNPNRWYAYVDVGGLYRSEDGGRSWAMLHGGLPPVRGNYSVRGLLVDPRDDNRLVIATGSRWSKTDGIYVSDDAGKTWRSVTKGIFFDGNGPPRSAGLILQRHPTKLDRLFAASIGTGLWRSEDNGETWEMIGMEHLQPTDLKIDRSNPDRMWLCSLKGEYNINGQREQAAGFYRSTDGGATWTRLVEDSPAEILQDPVEPNRLYGLRRGQVLISQDAGETWADFTDGLLYDPAKQGSTSDFSYRAIASGPDFVIVGSCHGSVYHLTPGENSWQKVEGQLVDRGAHLRNGGGWGWAMASLVVSPHDPNHWFFTDFFGVSQTRDAGKTWAITLDGIEVTVIHTVMQDPTDPGVVHLGMADNAYFRSEDGGENFSRHPFPQGAITCKEIDLSAKLPARLYAVGATMYGQQIGQVYVSIDRGDTWERSPMLGLPPLTRDMCTSITVHPEEPYTVFLCVSGNIKENGPGVYQSTDGGKSWTWIGQGLPEGQPFFWQIQWAQGRQLAVSPDGTMVAISKQTQRIYVRDAGASTWQKVERSLSGAPHCVVADVLKPGRFFMGVRGDGLYRSEDFGHTWNRVVKGSVTHVMTDRAVADRVAAATDNGIILSTDGGSTWTELDRNLPDRVEGNMLAFAGDRLVVGSDGSGAFWIPLTREGRKTPTAKPVVRAELPEEWKKPPQAPKLTNTGGESGKDQPAGWRLWTGAGQAELIRDTETYRVGKASIAIRSTSDETRATAYQEFEPNDTPFTVTFWGKSEGVRKAQLAIQVFDKDDKQIDWIILGDFHRGAEKGKWTTSRQITLPAAAHSCRLNILVEGAGTAWVDDIRIKAHASEVFP